MYWIGYIVGLWKHARYAIGSNILRKYGEGVYDGFNNRFTKV